MELRRMCSARCHQTTWQTMTFVNIEKRKGHQDIFEINFSCSECGNKVKEILTHNQLHVLMAGDKWRERQYTVA